ncbi:hypothetical protein [Vibrio sp. WXL210]|uniref:hypothetical protein n=1 Tax=Vibrio sp. WXL210 TaxID=3450709 RepID=UPI003EC4F3C5
MRIYYTITTIEPIIISGSTATTNGHQSLDYIPGSAVLGSIAGTLYPLVSEEIAWDLFHSGQVQYSPCYPLVNNEITLPTPACWHYKKLTQPIVDDVYDPAQVSNQASPDFQRAEGIQYKQCRDGFVASDARVGKVTLGVTTKTAIERSSGSVKKSTLFNYQYIEKGQVFGGYIEYESEAQGVLIREHLLGEKRIGRSRHTEFGLVDIQECHRQDEVVETSLLDDRLVIWCLSDCQLVSHQGLPTFTPLLSELIEGAKGELDTAHSFIRSKRISLFNRARGGVDSEQAVIAKGSVLVYRNVSLTTAQLNLIGQKGIGINRQQGLGWVEVNPHWAASARLNKAPLFSRYLLAPKLEKQPESDVSQPESLLVKWVHSKHQEQVGQVEQHQKVNGLIADILSAYQHVRSYNRVGTQYAIGPSKTQWGRVRAAVATKPENWQALLFAGRTEVKGEAVCKSANDPFGWGAAWNNGQQLIDFSTYISKLFADCSLTVIAIATERLSRYDLSYANQVALARHELLQTVETQKEVQA